MLYAKRYGTSEPEIEVFGKPSAWTFTYARDLLEIRGQAVGSGERGMKRIYMVGGEKAGSAAIRRETTFRGVYIFVFRIKPA